MKEIPLTQGKVALVDDEDFDRVNQFKWCAAKLRNSFYAVRREGSRNLLMHRFILGATTATKIDHEDQNGLNNQRYNLRHSTLSQNGANSRKREKTYSKYKGVTWSKRDGTWFARITFQRKNIHLGTFESEEDAAHVYDYAAKTYFGEFARLNFPE